MWKNENQCKAAVVKRLRQQGAAVLSVHGSLMQEPGWPDIQVYHARLPSGCAHLEMKKGSGKVSTAQYILLRKLRNAGVFAPVVTLVRHGAASYFRYQLPLIDKTELGLVAVCSRLPANENISSVDMLAQIINARKVLLD